ncbi:MAG: LON peptidase substrate-binding domain-containing protein [Alphaproteobacteria bacterium]|nr:LON peptidase substrate-binding domain-containing protein [Alphaproteobacteria bacterium]MBU1515030.1 LON peptidase substrate-binding domain-containing protein [Alphaproteobacteria bacterium]MBU2095679.1 LON peptidase substrate-binding domain-containing protein [Alphaproteobacteria bacterium]MBU2152826.1 LON peptidase substrate-binding domain-containing protein [Alphaproteobacteria bacterium]MBU2306880.1 LON peptidase substrate-binding domain-containing protein [Alphaproteobacteria bacterium
MASYNQLSDLPQLIPVFPLDGALLLPGGELPLQIFEPRYLNMIDDAMAGDRVIGMIQTRGGSRLRPKLAQVGCVGRITSYAETPDGRYLITLTGVCRFQAGEELDLRLPYRQLRANYERFGDDLDDEEAEASEDARARFATALKRYLNQRELDIDWETAHEAPLEALVNSLCMGLPFDPAEKQAFLEAPDLAGRFEVLTTLLEIDATDPDDEHHSLQ